jgi:hypothetical protein
MISSFIQNIGFWPLAIYSLLFIGLWIYSILGVVSTEFKDSNMKLIWILIILFAPIIGAIVYLILAKSTKSLTY